MWLNILFYNNFFLNSCKWIISSSTVFLLNFIELIFSIVVDNLFSVTVDISFFLTFSKSLTDSLFISSKIFCFSLKLDLNIFFNNDLSSSFKDSYFSLNLLIAISITFSLINLSSILFFSSLI